MLINIAIGWAAGCTVCTIFGYRFFKIFGRT
jgi:hypothetical protein